VHREKRRIEAELRRLSSAAVKIQALWRGHAQRKQTGPALNSIRNRLSSIYMSRSAASAEANTLGARIRHALLILRHPCHPIQQIMLALTDLVKVTQLSPECCLFFTRQGAVATLYAFILNCNRSVPHIDLVKLCLHVLVNLAKYAATQADIIVAEANAMDILVSLLQAYYVSNPVIFMNVCILLIILAEKYEETKRQIVSDTVFVKKLEQIYAGLERRAQFSQQNASEQVRKHKLL
jgi:abnormal spindle-like microcephaly-associated protein